MKHSYTACVFQDTVSGKFVKLLPHFMFELVPNVEDATETYIMAGYTIPANVKLIRRGIEVTKTISMID